MDGLASGQASLLQAMIDRLVVAYGMTCPNPAGLRQAEGLVEWWVAPDREVEALHYVESGRVVIRPLGPTWHIWSLTLTAMGAVQNWIAASIDARDGLDDRAIALLADIDHVTDGLLGNAVRTGMLHLGNRQIALGAASRDDQQAQAALGRVDRELGMRRAPAGAGSGFNSHPAGADDLSASWLAWPGPTPKAVAWPGAIAGEGGSPTAGYRVLVEFVVNARSVEDAALTLAAELDGAARGDVLLSSFQALGVVGGILERALRDLALATPRAHAGGLPLAGHDESRPDRMLDRIGA